jgi:hypothetical protein
LIGHSPFRAHKALTEKESFMDRRSFVFSSVLTGLSAGVSLVGKAAQAQPTAPKSDELCPLKMDSVLAEATYFSRYEHFHLLAVPVSVLAHPPAQGYQTRTTALDQDSLDEDAFAKFIKESGLNGASLRHHSHEVHFTPEELARIARGEKNVKITVPTAMGNLAHIFYFTATRCALVKIGKLKN